MEQSESLVARWLAAGDAGDVEAFDELLHGDVVVHAPRGLSTEASQGNRCGVTPWQPCAAFATMCRRS